MRHLLLLAACSLAACSAQVDYNGAGFQCNEDEPCQPGYDCVNGTCQLGGGDLPDAGADAGPDDPDAGLDCLPPIALTDDFNGQEISNQWNVSEGSNTAADIVNNRLELTAGSDDLPSFAILRSKDSFDFADRRVFFEVVNMRRANTAKQTFLGAGSGQDFFFLGMTESEMQFGTQQGGRTVHGTAPYTENEDVFWQLRQQGGDMIGEVSTDGQSWREIGRTSADAIAGPLSVRLGAGTEENVNNPGSIVIDNLNLGAPLCE